MTATALAARPALALQDLFTVVTRLRADRQPVRDAAAFRTHVRALLTKADQAMTSAGYASEDSRFALFAAVAMLDETVLNSKQASLAEWSRRPLQDELFNVHMGGELFFKYLDQLQARPDDAVLADILEVFHHALLLGFRGRYGADDQAREALAQRLGDRIARIRGASGDLAPAWRPATDTIITADPWIRRLGGVAVGVLVLTVALWIVGRVSLASTNGDLRAVTSTSPR